MFGDYRPRHEWSDDEKRMHSFFPKVMAIGLGACAVVTYLVVLLVRSC